jgi:hypothetical protein
MLFIFQIHLLKTAPSGDRAAHMSAPPAASSGRGKGLRKSSEKMAMSDRDGARLPFLENGVARLGFVVEDLDKAEAWLKHLRVGP